MNYPTPEYVVAPTGHPHDPTTDDDGPDIDETVEALMANGAEYDPYSARNLSEAMGAMWEHNHHSLGLAIREQNAAEMLAIIGTLTTLYWESRARDHAEQEAKRANGVCLSCSGEGCSGCSWIGNKH